MESASYINTPGYKVDSILVRVWNYTIQVPRGLEEEGKPRRGSRVMQTYSSYSLIIQQIVGCLIKRLLFFRDCREFGMRGTKYDIERCVHGGH